MQWDGYTVFSVISGIAMVATALVGKEKASSRALYFLVGLGFVGYGFYVANQTSGYFTFPVVIFIFPFLIVIRAVAAMLTRSRSRAGVTGQAPAASGQAPAGPGYGQAPAGSGYGQPPAGPGYGQPPAGPGQGGEAPPWDPRSTGGPGTI